MLMTTTPIIEGKRIVKYYGIVSGETIIGANVFRDLFASIRDIVGGRSGSYEEVLRMAKDTALKEMEAQAAQMGANAVIGVDLDYETVGGSGSMLMVTANGTAVKIEEDSLIIVSLTTENTEDAAHILCLVSMVYNLCPPYFCGEYYSAVSSITRLKA